MSKEEIIEVDMSCFWINLDNPKEVSYQPKENGNWKAIILEGYANSLTPGNNDDIVYRLKKYSTQGYIHKPKQRR